ncbi:peptidase S24/S26A/S26B/S26C [Syncephalis plumigaleata]|nr:peptidase S24/S26A/S26B/S26C [Syncephalis plumigaleata]
MFTRLPRPLASVIAWTPVALVFLDHGYTLAIVQGRSMQPTLNPDSNRRARDIILLNRRSPQPPRTNNGSGGYQRGDIVTLYSPTDPHHVIIKRVIATAGDKVQINNQPDSYAASFSSSNEPSWITVPRGHCWVEGDDPFHSRDSNAFGPVPVGLIQSRVVCVVWPLRRFGTLDSFNSAAHPRVIQGTSTPVDESSPYEQSIDWQESKQTILSRQ